jgi:hypothetical protein
LRCGVARGGSDRESNARKTKENDGSPQRLAAGGRKSAVASCDDEAGPKDSVLNRSVTAILKFTRKLKNSYQLNLKTVILKINWILPWVGTYK